MKGPPWQASTGARHDRRPTDQDDVWDALADRMLTPIAGLHIEKVGIDSGFRDPSGNSIRLTQVREGMSFS